MKPILCLVLLLVGTMGQEAFFEEDYVTPAPNFDDNVAARQAPAYSPSFESNSQVPQYTQGFLETQTRESPAGEQPQEEAPQEEESPAPSESESTVSTNDFNKPGFSKVSPGLKPVAVDEPKPSDSEEEEEIERIVGGKLSEAEKHYGETIFDEKHDKEVEENIKAAALEKKKSCAEGGDCVTAETSAPGFSPGDESPEAQLSQKMIEIKDALLRKAKVVTKEQAWLEETSNAISSQQKKMEKIKSHVEDERKAIQALLEKRAQLKKQEKQQELEARLKFASDQLGSLTDALKQVKDREDSFFETKQTLSSKISELENSLAKLKGKSVSEMKREQEKKKIELMEEERKSAEKQQEKEREESNKIDKEAAKEAKEEKKEEKAKEEAVKFRERRLRRFRKH